MGIKKVTKNFFLMTFVGVTGLEPATAWSQTRNATNCATPRIELLRCKSCSELGFKKSPRKRILMTFVGVTGLEPATAWSQTRNATNCATPRRTNLYY